MTALAPTRLAAIALVVVLMLGGCAGSTSNPPPDDGTSATPPPATDAGGAAGTRLAAGLHEQADGTVVAIGTLEWSDIEGGFWAVIGGTEATGDAGKVVAVIPDVTEQDAAYAALVGKTVQVTGTRIEGASIRNAGPEIAASSISEVTDTPGIAE